MPFKSPLTALVAVLIAIAPAAFAAIPVKPIYSSFAGDGFNDPLFGSTRRAVFQAAADYFGSLFDPSYPGEELLIHVSMIEQGGSVATASPEGFISGFGSNNPLYRTNASYTVAMANHLAGRTIATGPVASVTFNSNVDFDYGTTNKIDPNKESFYTTAIHEIAHGVAFFDKNDGSGEYIDSGIPSIFDFFVQLGTAGNSLLLEMTVPDRQAALISDNLYFNGSRAVQAFNNQLPRLYAPTNYSLASSVSHLDYRMFETESLLLHPSALEGRPERFTFTAVEIAMLYDLGWTPASKGISNGPHIVGIQRTPGGGTQINLKTVPGGKYRVRFSSNTGGNIAQWQILGQTHTANGNSLEVHDHADEPMRFYIVEQLP